MFIGRKQELAELERRFNQNGFQFPVIYGRRRVGKTRLIQEFIANKKSIYFMATRQNSKEQLKSFTQTIKEQFFDEKTKYLETFDSWESLFSYIFEISKNERIIFVIDEYPYLAECEKSIQTLIQKFIDNHWKNSELFLILCGSSMSFMEEQVLEYGSPLYGRRTEQLKIHPFPYYESIEFFPNWTLEEKMFAYGVCGGIPLYLEYFSKYENFKDAVLSLVLIVGAVGLILWKIKQKIPSVLLTCFASVLFTVPLVSSINNIVEAEAKKKVLEEKEIKDSTENL